MQATGLISKLKVVYYAKETRWAGLTVQLPLNEVHPVRDLVLDRVYVVQEVDLPLLMLPAVIGRLPRTSSALFSSLSLGPRAADWSLETFRGNSQDRTIKTASRWSHSDFPIKNDPFPNLQLVM